MAMEYEKVAEVRAYEERSGELREQVRLVNVDAANTLCRFLVAALRVLARGLELPLRRVLQVRVRHHQQH